MSEKGSNISLDFGISNKRYLGKGLAAPTLQEFIHFYKNSVNPGTDTFFIDPDKNNPRAHHVYEKARFKQVGKYDVTQGAFIGSVGSLMVMIFPDGV